jgi:translocation and assembly module TamB
MRVVPLGVNLSSISGGVRLRGDTVLVDSLVGYSGGLIRIAGGLGIKQIAKPSIDLRVRADNARVLDNERGNVLADAQIAAYGPFASVRVSGGARVRQGVLYIPEPTDKQVISASDPSLFHVADTTNAMVRELLPVQSPLLANLRADVRLSVDRDTWVRSREANIEIYTDGDLRVAMDRRTQAVALEGVVLTDRGDYTLLGKRFQVRAGSVQFIGTSDINPLLQIGAIYNVLRPGREALTIRVLIGGTLDAPKLTLESDAQPPISQSDLLSYLAFGSESSTLLQGQGASSLTGGGSSGNLIGASAALASRQLAAVALGVAVDQLEGQAARSLGADVLEITPADVPLSGGFKEGRNFLEGTRVEFGRYFQRNTFLAITGQGFRVAPGMQLQHRFARFPGLSLEAAYDTRFLLREPSLDFIDPEQRKAFGMFLKRTWRF